MNRAFGIGLVAVGVLLLGLWAAVNSQRSGNPRELPGSGPDLPEPAPDVVARAMESAPAVVDSAEIKSRWHDEVRGVDLAGLDDPQRELFVRFANAGQCTCGCGYTLAGCKASDMSCEVSGERLAALRDSIRAGWIRSADGVRERPGSPGGGLPHAGG